MPPSKSSSSVPTIPHPLHLLILTPGASSHPQDLPKPSNTPAKILSPLLQALTTHSPADGIESFSGYTSHPPLKLETSYYRAEVGVWCDVIPVPVCGSTANAPPNAKAKEEGDGTTDDAGAGAGKEEEGNVTEQWTKEFLSEEAKEVLTALGAVILLLPSSTTPGSLRNDKSMSVFKAARDVREKAEEERVGGDVVGICVLVSPAGGKRSGDEEAEEEEKVMEALGLGWDVVFWDGRPEVADKDKGKKNEFGGAFFSFHFLQYPALVHVLFYFHLVRENDSTEMSRCIFIYSMT
jgi:hypothetical protein